MNKEINRILENQKLILRCLLYNDNLAIKGEVHLALSETNKILFSPKQNLLTDKTKQELSEDALGGEEE